MEAIGSVALILKYILGFFILIGIATTLYGLYQVLGTMTFVKDSPERVQATFVGYHREVVETTSTSPSTDWSHPSTEKSYSVMSYPCFEYRTKDGTLRQVCESKIHLIERFKRGQKVDIILHPFHPPRLAGFYSLYARDLTILILGLAFIFIPLLIWKVAIPSLESPAGIEVTRFWKEAYERVVSISVGPISFVLILKVFAGFMILILCISLVSSAIPFIQQLHLGTGWGLIEALQKKDFDVARELIIKRKGIHKVNEYHQNPLLLALEAGQPELAKLLVEAGSDVNIKSKMYMTPLRIATQSGNLEMVKLLLTRGAVPDAPEDEFPPAIYALSKGYDEIACILIEAGTDLNRQYITEKGRLTVGDIALLARKPELVDLIRKRGGKFTLPKEAIYQEKQKR
jgi:hypothetical protein